jgi:hypothetical protein
LHLRVSKCAFQTRRAPDVYVEEKQWFRYDAGAGMACVRSTPVLVSPRSDSFRTEVTVYLSPVAGDDRSRWGSAR